MEDSFRKEKELDYKTIVFKAIDSIREKFLNEFRGGGKRTVLKGDWAETTIEPDSRKEAVQIIEFLSDLLQPEFDKATRDKYTEIMKRADELKIKVNKNEIDRDNYILEKLELMRELFRVMMIRLKETGYLKQKSVVG